MIDDYDESSGWMFLLVPAHPGFPGQIPQSRKTVVCVCVYRMAWIPVTVSELEGHFCCWVTKYVAWSLCNSREFLYFTPVKMSIFDSDSNWHRYFVAWIPFLSFNRTASNEWMNSNHWIQPRKNYLLISSFLKHRNPKVRGIAPFMTTPPVKKYCT